MKIVDTGDSNPIDSRIWNRMAPCPQQISDSSTHRDRRRHFFKLAGVLNALTLGAMLAAGPAAADSRAAALARYADPAESALPRTDVEISLADTALVITDPQVDFLHPNGVTWGIVGESVTELGTVGNIETLLKTAKAAGIPVFISPHHYYPTDHAWKDGGPLEQLMHSIGMFDRKGAYTLDGFEGSGSDFMPQYKRYILDGKTIIASPHKIYGPEQNDLVLQLRRRGINKVILAGMSANLCIESHLRELLEQGFQVAVVRDATAAAKVPEGDGYLAALINFRFLANGLWTTGDAAERIKAAK